MAALGTPPRVRVLIAHEHRVFRDALEVALETFSDLEVAAAVGDGFEALAGATRTHPDVAIVDAALPMFDGIRTSCLIKERVPECRVLVLADAEDLRTLAAGVGCGASGFATKNTTLVKLVASVRALHRGETLIPPVMLGPLLSRLIDSRPEPEAAVIKIAELSRREREVLVLIARGARTAAIAEALVISPETARKHVQHILRKLGVHSRLEAAALVIENGLLEHLAPRLRAVPSGVADSS